MDGDKNEILHGPQLLMNYFGEWQSLITLICGPRKTNSVKGDGDILILIWELYSVAWGEAQVTPGVFRTLKSLQTFEDVSIDKNLHSTVSYHVRQTVRIIWRTILKVGLSSLKS